MLIFTNLLLLFAVILLIFGFAVYYAAYTLSGNLYLNYYPNGSTNPSLDSHNFIQNGTTSIKYLSIYMIIFGIIAIFAAVVNEKLRLSEKAHHLKMHKPLH